MLPYTPAHFFRTFSLRLYYSFFDASIFDIIDQKEINKELFRSPYGSVTCWEYFANDLDGLKARLSRSWISISIKNFAKH